MSTSFSTFTPLPFRPVRSTSTRSWRNARSRSLSPLHGIKTMSSTSQPRTQQPTRGIEEVGMLPSHEYHPGHSWLPSLAHMEAEVNRIENVDEFTVEDVYSTFYVFDDIVRRMPEYQSVLKSVRRIFERCIFPENSATDRDQHATTYPLPFFSLVRRLQDELESLEDENLILEQRLLQLDHFSEQRDYLEESLEKANEQIGVLYELLEEQGMSKDKIAEELVQYRVQSETLQSEATKNIDKLQDQLRIAIARQSRCSSILETRSRLGKEFLMEISNRSLTTSAIREKLHSDAIHVEIEALTSSFKEISLILNSRLSEYDMLYSYSASSVLVRHIRREFFASVMELINEAGCIREHIDEILSDPDYKKSIETLELKSRDVKSLLSYSRESLENSRINRRGSVVATEAPFEDRGLLRSSMKSNQASECNSSIVSSTAQPLIAKIELAQDRRSDFLCKRAIAVEVGTSDVFEISLDANSRDPSFIRISFNLSDTGSNSLVTDMRLLQAIREESDPLSRLCHSLLWKGFSFEHPLWSLYTTVFGESVPSWPRGIHVSHFQMGIDGAFDSLSRRHTLTSSQDIGCVFPSTLSVSDRISPVAEEGPSCYSYSLYDRLQSIPWESCHVDPLVSVTSDVKIYYIAFLYLALRFFSKMT